MMKLSTRESQIVDLIQLGLRNKEIGQDLGISAHTVRDHISKMLVRDGLNGRAALAFRCSQKSAAPTVGAAWDGRVASDRRVLSPPPRANLYPLMLLHL
jgi:DNA-binding CsgD family transcriptional regulator